ncbi:MAG: cob(I)yrinic acid a,c-diamide adenosyltransferase, partial [Cyanobacteria bacterium P01_D01_bin.44]
MTSSDLDQTATRLDDEALQAGLSDQQYKRKMARRKEVQDKRLAERSQEKGLVIVNTGNGKGKTTAALGM